MPDFKDQKLASASHEVRELRYRLRQLGRDYGRASDTIYRLRGEVALLREKLGSKEYSDRRAQETLLFGTPVADELDPFDEEDQAVREYRA